TNGHLLQVPRLGGPGRRRIPQRHDLLQTRQMPRPLQVHRHRSRRWPARLSPLLVCRWHLQLVRLLRWQEFGPLVRQEGRQDEAQEATLRILRQTRQGPDLVDVDCRQERRVARSLARTRQLWQDQRASRRSRPACGAADAGHRLVHHHRPYRSAHPVVPSTVGCSPVDYHSNDCSIVRSPSLPPPFPNELPSRIPNSVSTRTPTTTWYTNTTSSNCRSISPTIPYRTPHQISIDAPHSPSLRSPPFMTIFIRIFRFSSSASSASSIERLETQ
ncbi:hypothetical protein PFISCL1PPCAC_25643, partial [Pristionchus fissidentatus]